MLVYVLAVIAAVLISGCGGNPTIATPNFNSKKSANKAMELFDTNNDGLLDASELEASPGLRAGLKTLDADGDNMISRDEIVERINQFIESGSGAFSVQCRFTKGSKPITNAEVVFTPEPFLEGIIAPAQGKTKDAGTASMICAATPFGMQQGFYRVSIDNGSLPAKYNTETELGTEVSDLSTGHQIGIYEFKLN